MAWTDIEKVRIEIGDTDPAFPLLADDTYAYYLDKHSNNITRAAQDAAKTILFQLSTQNSETVDIFSVRNTSAEAYKQALMMYLKNPSLNPIYNNLSIWAGNISKTEIQANKDNVDNNYVKPLRESTIPVIINGFNV